MSSTRSPYGAGAMWASRVVFFFLFWYAGSYVLMMDWRFPAYDMITDQWTNESGYRMRHNTCVCRPFTTVVRPRCWANHIFWPIDWVRSQIASAVGIGRASVFVDSGTTAPTLETSDSPCLGFSHQCLPISALETIPRAVGCTDRSSSEKRSARTRSRLFDTCQVEQACKNNVGY
jgi:hypothetical protein